MDPRGHITRPSPGQPLTETILSANWLNGLIDLASGHDRTGRSQGDEDVGIPLAVPVVDGSPVALTAGSVVGVSGFAYPASPTVEPMPKLQATKFRGFADYYVKTESPAVAGATVYGFPFGATPVRVKVKDPPGSGYARKYIEGLPVGRLEGDTVLSAGGGGLILVSKPYKETGGTSYFAWVIADIVGVWPAVAIRPATSSGYAAPTNYLTGPGTLVAGIINPLSASVTADVAKDTVTDCRVTIRLRDTNENYVDGTPLLIKWSQGEWKIVDAGCVALTGLTGKTKEP